MAPLVGAAVPVPHELPLPDAGRPRGPHGGIGDRGAAEPLLHLGHGHRGVPRQAGRHAPAGLRGRRGRARARALQDRLHDLGDGGRLRGARGDAPLQLRDDPARVRAHPEGRALRRHQPRRGRPVRAAELRRLRRPDRADHRQVALLRGQALRLHDAGGAAAHGGPLRRGLHGRGQHGDGHHRRGAERDDDGPGPDRRLAREGPRAVRPPARPRRRGRLRAAGVAGAGV